MSISDHTNPIDPRENADTANQTDTAAAPSGTEPTDTAEDIGTARENTVDVVAYPVTDTVLRYSDGTPYCAYGSAKAGPRTITYRIIMQYGCTNVASPIITLRAETTPRNPAEAKSMVPPDTIVAETRCYGDFRTALSLARSMCGGYAARLARLAARHAARKARKAAQDAPKGVDAANTPAEAEERF